MMIELKKHKGKGQRVTAIKSVDEITTLIMGQWKIGTEQKRRIEIRDGGRRPVDPHTRTCTVQQLQKATGSFHQIGVVMDEATWWV